jgi:hypothetical protein
VTSSSLLAAANVDDEKIRPVQCQPPKNCNLQQGFSAESVLILLKNPVAFVINHDRSQTEH